MYSLLRGSVNQRRALFAFKNFTMMVVHISLLYYHPQEELALCFSFLKGNIVVINLHGHIFKSQLVGKICNVFRVAEVTAANV